MSSSLLLFTEFKVLGTFDCQLLFGFAFFAFHTQCDLFRCFRLNFSQLSLDTVKSLIIDLPFYGKQAWFDHHNLVVSHYNDEHLARIWTLSRPCTA